MSEITLDVVNNSCKNPLIRGAKIEAGGYSWEMPPLNLRQLREFMEDSKAAPEGDERALFEVSLKALHAALSRNYPLITLDHCLDMIDAGNYKTVLQIMNGASGVVPAGEDRGA